ncbi:MAG TPA: heparinase II/III-family protein, partial [Alphaproteobacteria bacterium]|nr:heparinase II/III-family protein [Alphaproteobacteria bacterium]
FHRVMSNRTLLIADMGPPPPPGARDHTFAGTLSLEMSVGKERMIVNCGGGPGLGAAWRQALRASAAHSTLTLADTNSTEIFESPGAGSEIGKHPGEVTGRMAESEGAVWLTGRHDGYVQGFGLIHERRLWLAPGGEELRGEDLLLPPGMTGPAQPEREEEERKSSIWRWRRDRPKVFHLRFHLHPGVSASLVHEGGAVLLRLPSGGGWQFRAEGGNIALEDSVYLGSGEVKRSSQIVVSGGVTAEGPRPGAVVRWSLKRVAER